MEVNESRKITDGVYLVIDPGMEKTELLLKLAMALKGGLAAVQIWNHWPAEVNKLALVAAISGLCKAERVPLLIDNDWELLRSSPGLDGVHFDAIPENFAAIKKKISRPFLSGITCSGDLDIVKWAHNNKLDYVSFCAVYPSSSSASCPIVTPASIKAATEFTDLPLFVSGGITPENIPVLRKETTFHGVAVISGIMKAEDSFMATIAYKNSLNIKQEDL